MYEPYYTESSDLMSLFAFLGGLLIFLFIVIIIAYVINALLYSKLAKKAGISEHWAGWIPLGIYYLGLRMGKLPIWLLFIPVLNLFAGVDGGMATLSALATGILFIVMDYHTLKSFGHNENLAFFHLFPLIGSLIVLIKLITMANDKGTVYLGTPSPGFSSNAGVSAGKDE